jgi:hypothetical protein
MALLRFDKGRTHGSEFRQIRVIVEHFFEPFAASTVRPACYFEQMTLD